MQWLRRLFAVADDLIFPRRVWCITCQELSGGQLLCPQCRERLTALQLTEQDGAVRSAFRYKDEVRQLVHALKFDGVRNVVDILAPAMGEVASGMCLPQDTVVTWVTMPEKRRLARGMDHARLLAEALGKAQGLPVRQMLLRVKTTREQHTLRSAERRRNLVGAFRATGPVAHPVLIVDDVYTTGATMKACTKALMDAGATQVYGLTVARSEGHIYEVKGADSYGLFPARMGGTGAHPRQHRGSRGDRTGP